jgi:hypothetical protein
VQQNLKDVGIDAKFEALEFTKFTQVEHVTEEYEAFCFYYATPATPDQHSYWQTNGSFNIWGYSNAEIDRLLQLKGLSKVDELFAAYYAADPEQVLAFCRKHHISFLVVDDRHFTPAFLAGGWFLFPYEQAQRPGTPRGLAERNYCPFFAPFDAQIRELVQGRTQFALLTSPLFHPVQLDEHLRLLDMRPFLSPTP